MPFLLNISLLYRIFKTNTVASIFLYKTCIIRRKIKLSIDNIIDIERTFVLVAF
jgi:hypothetical protein